MTREKNGLRGNTSGTELSVAETAGQLGDGVTGTAEEVDEEGGSDISACRVLNLLEGGGEAVLVGAVCKFLRLLHMDSSTYVSFLEQAPVITWS